MANELALDTADRVHVVGAPDPTGQLPGIALEAIEAGAPVRIDATTGKFANGNGTDMTEGKIYGIALSSVAAGEALTVMSRGRLSGFTFGSIAYGATIYVSDTDGRLSHVAGTKAVTVGYVVPGIANVRGAALDKILEVRITLAAAIT